MSDRALNIFTLLLFAITLYCDGENDVTFVKNDRFFARIIQNETITLQNSSSKRIPDYVYTAQTLLDMLERDDDSVTARNLNKFNLGLHQFYLSLAYEAYYNRSASEHPVGRYDDPIQMPDGTAFGEPELCFYGVRAYGFPGFKKWQEVIDGEANDPYLQHFKTRRQYTSDVFIFTGHFRVFNRGYFFVYRTKNNTLKSVQTKWRSNEGTIKAKKIKDILSFDHESLTHTYESTRKSYTLMNETLYTKFIAVLEQLWLPNLMSTMYHRMYPRYVRDNAQFAFTYRQKVSQLLVESVVHYMRKTNSTTAFHAPPMKFTSQTAHRVYVQIYENIKLEGFTNFDKYELRDPKIEEHSEQVAFSDTIVFTYSDDRCFASFTVNDGRRGVDKKHLVRSISVTAAYYVRANEWPLKVNRKRDAFENGNGFSISFELNDFDPVHEFVVEHLSNDITAVIDSVLQNESDLFEEDIFK